MLVPWMIYAVAVAAAVGVAALLAEGALRALGRPTRWAWVGALAASVLVPALAAWLAPAGSPALPAASAVVPLEGITAVGASVSGTPGVGAVLGGAWALASGVLLLLFAHGWIRLAAWRSEWEIRVVDGRTVLVSRSTGPAVVGIWPGRIVLPRWILDLEPSRRGMILAHEAEHLGARDPLLLFAGSLPVVAFPWNPILWWMRARLRAAVEIDCDERVVGRTERTSRRYGELLLDVGARSRVPAGVFPGFAERPSLLERRLLALTRGTPERPLRSAGYLVAGALALVAVACGIPTPDALTAPEVTADEAETSPREAEPVFTPFTVRPELRNASEVQRTLSEEYPPLLRDAGVGGTTTVWFFIDAEGRVEQTRIARSSGHEAIDEAALRVAATMEFTPARNRDERVAVWVQFPITFQVR